MKRVLICGGRSFGLIPRDLRRGSLDYARAATQAAEERQLLAATLDAYRAEHGIACLIHGAASGADGHAAGWASERGVPVAAFPADWGDLSHPEARIKTAGGRRYDANAGPRRNARMLAEGRPDVVISFRGGRGTADMIGRAEAVGVPVIRAGDTN